jgi:hypothetical protein
MASFCRVAVNTAVLGNLNRYATGSFRKRQRFENERRRADIRAAAEARKEERVTGSILREIRLERLIAKMGEDE